MTGRLSRALESLRTARRLAPDLAPHRRRLAVVGLLSAATAVLGAAQPWPVQWIFDRALAPAPEAGLPLAGLVGGAGEGPSFAVVVWSGVAALVVIAALGAGANYLRTVQIGLTSHAYVRSLRHRLFSHLAGLSPRFYARHKSGDLLVRLVGDVSIVSDMMVDSAIELATRVLLVLVTVGIMLALDPILTGLLLVAIPLLFLVVRFISRRITVAVRKQRRKEAELADFLHEAIAAAPVIQSLGGEGHVVRRFARSNRRSERAGMKAKRLAAGMSGTVEALLAVGLGATLAMGSFRVQTGDLTPGELLVFLSYVRGMLKPIRASAKHAHKIAKGAACGERILDVLDERERVRSAPGAPPAPAEPRTLAFERVSFSYDGGGSGRDRALEEVTLVLRRGELTLVAGPNGAGKSTVAALALRLFDPDSGRVALDGRSLCDLELESVRARVGLVLQHAVLFGESVRENLLLARPDATDEELWRACREAGADAFLRELPGGLDAELGAAGAGLSGGQRARLSLARTLLRRTPILIVDEPFAGLDRDSARRVAATLRELARERIVAVIAHDVPDLDAYDRAVLLERGRVVAEGPVAEIHAALPLHRAARGPRPEVAP